MGEGCNKIPFYETTATPLPFCCYTSGKVWFHATPLPLKLKFEAVAHYFLIAKQVKRYGSEREGELPMADNDNERGLVANTF